MDVVKVPAIAVEREIRPVKGRSEGTSDTGGERNESYKRSY